MGTNYYLSTRSSILHIGKSSSGWCFSLHVLPEIGILSLEDWKKKFRWGTIKDEYGGKVSTKEMLECIKGRSRESPLDWSEEDYDKNHGEPGPNNLIRHKIDQYCIGHGEGTWDLILGNFF